MAVKFLDKTGLGYFWGKIKAWCNSTFATKVHTHTSYATKHSYTTAANAAKDWYRIANANTSQINTSKPIHAQFILTAYNTSYDAAHYERWFVNVGVFGRVANIVIFGGTTAPFSQARVLYESTTTDIDTNDRPALDIYLNYVLSDGTTKIEIEEVYNQGWTFVADGQLAVSTIPNGFENVACSVRYNGIERSTYSDYATYLNKPRREITANTTLADNSTYRSTTLNCTGTITITVPSINNNYAWFFIKNANAASGVITVHPSTTSVLIDESNADITLQPNEYIIIHSRAGNKYSIIADGRWKSQKADKATTLSGYGITDAKIASGTITLGSNTITPLTSASSLNAAKLTGTASVNTTGKATTAGTADKVANKLTLKLKSGSTEGTDLYTYDGSGAKTLDIKQGSNITLTAASGSLTIAGVGDTKNTAGSTDSSSKLFLIGATSQAANPQTYSHDTAYVGTDGCLYSGGTKVLTVHQTLPTLSYTESGSGNAVTALSVSNHAITATKGTTFLTSHQDISGKVNKSGDTMTGNLTISKSAPAVILKNTGKTRNTAPSAAVNTIDVACNDSADKRLWGIYHTYGTDKSARTQLISYNGASTDNTWAGIGIGYDKNGNVSTNAPTPTVGDNSTKIATTAFVNTKCGDYLPLAGGTMSGNLVMHKSGPTIFMQNTAMVKGTKPSSNKYSGIYFLENTTETANTNRFGGIELGDYTDGNVKLNLFAYQSAADSSASACLSVVKEFGGTGYCTCPTPATADNSTKIATTAFVKAQGYLTSHQTLPTLSKTDSGSGNAVTAISVSNHAITVTKGSKFALDSNVIHKDSNEAISGIKEFGNSYYDSTVEGETGWESSSLIIRYKNYVKGSGAPSANKYANLLFLDKTGNNINWNGRLGSVESSVNSSGECSVFISCYKNEIINGVDTRDRSILSVGYDSNGNKFASCSSTSENRNHDGDILTRDWIPKDTRIVHTTGNETISGVKTFTQSPFISRENPYLYIKETDIARGSGITADHSSYAGLVFRDKNDKETCYVVGRFYGTLTDKHYCLLLQANDGTSASSTKNAQVMLMYWNDHKHSFSGDPSNDVLLGTSSRKWKEVWCTQSSLNSSSDERLKSNITNLSDDVLDAWEEVNWVQYQFNDAIEEKGSNARLHVGTIAQSIDRIFKSRNLDIAQYGLFLYDEWEETPEAFDKDGNLVQHYQAAGNEYGIRYVEALCMEAAYQRRKNKILENRISELEKQVSDMLQILQNLTSSNG